MVGTSSSTRNHRNTYSEGSPNVQYKPYQLTEKDWVDVKKYIMDLQKTDHPCGSIPIHIWQSLPAKTKREIIDTRKGKTCPQSSSDTHQKDGRREMSRAHSISHHHYEGKSSFQRSRPKYVDHDPNDPLSDDAFTARYDQDYWSSLPYSVKYEIERQRFVKKERAQKAQKAAAKQASSC